VRTPCRKALDPRIAARIEGHAYGRADVDSSTPGMLNFMAVASRIR
jgi:hypothetical protein